MSTNTTPTTTAAPTKKATTPKLVCNITGKARPTTADYLAARLVDLGVDEPTYLLNYLCKEAAKLARAGKSVADIRKELKSTLTTVITPEELTSMIKMNGKQGGTAAGPIIGLREQMQAKAAAAATAPATAPLTVTPPATPKAVPAKVPAHAGK